MCVQVLFWRANFKEYAMLYRYSSFSQHNIGLTWAALAPTHWQAKHKNSQLQICSKNKNAQRTCNIMWTCYFMITIITEHYSVSQTTHGLVLADLQVPPSSAGPSLQQYTCWFTCWFIQDEFCRDYGSPIIFWLFQLWSPLALST
jgi:hypothetical protein